MDLPVNCSDFNIEIYEYKQRAVMLNLTVPELSETFKSSEAWQHPECLTYYNLTLNSIYINVTKNPNSRLNED